MIIFVHIPKTGGTSIRNAAAEHFGDDAMLYDYGKDAPLTSPAVRELLYEQDDFGALVAHIKDADVRFLSGHFKRDRYATPFPDADLLTWVRDPVQRVISLHAHRSRTHANSEPLPKFSAARPFRNGMVTQAGDAPDRYAVVGILERQAESIAAVNQRFDISLATRHDNASRIPPSIEPKLDTLIRNRNGRDAGFVDAAHAQLDGSPR